MLGGQLRQHRHQALVERRRVQIRQQDHQGPLPDPPSHRGHHRAGVGFHQRGLQRRHRVHQLREKFAARRVVDAGAGHPVVGDEVDVVARARCQRGEQERGVHRPIQSGPATGITGSRVHPDAAGRRAAGVEHDDDPTVALGPPRPHHHVCAPGGGAPVDGSDVVADDIFAQRIEFGALAADQHRRHAFEFPQLRQPRRQMLPRQERRQDPDLPRHPMRALPTGQTQRADRACGDKRGALIAAANRPQPCDETNLLARSRD